MGATRDQFTHGRLRHDSCCLLHACRQVGASTMEFNADQPAAHLIHNRAPNQHADQPTHQPHQPHQLTSLRHMVGIAVCWLIGQLVGMAGWQAVALDGLLQFVGGLVRSCRKTHCTYMWHVTLTVVSWWFGGLRLSTSQGHSRSHQEMSCLSSLCLHQSNLCLPPLGFAAR